MKFTCKPSEVPGLHKEVKKSKKTITKYWDEFYDLLKSGRALDIEAVLVRFPDDRQENVKGHLKAFIHYAPEYLEQVQGFYPLPDTIIDRVEADIGPISGAKVLEANEACKELIDKITKPRHEKFLKSLLSDYTDDHGQVRISSSDLIDRLYERYTAFSGESGNGLMSIAGSINEKILHRALEAEGLSAGQHYLKTGTEKKGDIQIQTQSQRHSQPLYCEVKSYNARERLLRGLSDIDGNKVGVGFFKDAKEFNPTRTTTLLQTGALAIYLPDTTLAQINPKSLGRVTSEGNLLYRPLTKFPSDMAYFNKNGKLPSFTSRQ